MSLPVFELFWDENNVEHLWQSHQVTPDEIEEIILGLEDDAPRYKCRRDGDAYVIYGETGNGRLLKMVGRFAGKRAFRVFGAIDMDDRERRSFRKGKR
jgi:uncharacterized DUF497 family protein